jgi:hypothetical protein
MPKPLEKVGRSFALLLIAAVCFQVGRWYGELETGARFSNAMKKADPSGTEMVKSTFHAPAETPKTVEPVPATTAGDPVGQASDIITPLNVRDPSALVMGPGPYSPPPECVPAAATVPAERVKPAKPLKAGRLLELLRKADKKSDVPKTF